MLVSFNIPECRLIKLIFCFKAQFDAGELITQRELVSQKVNEELTERASHFGVILDDIALVMYGL